MKKILSVFIALAMAVCLAAPVFADYDPVAHLGLQVGNPDNGGWGYEEVIDVTAPGTYTLTYDGESRDLGWIVIKSTDDNRDGSAVIETGIEADTTIRVTGIEIDGTAYAFDSGETYDGKTGFGGTVEIGLYNSFTGDDHIVNRPASASKVVVTFVVDPDNAPAEAAPEAEATVPEAEAPEAEVPAPEAETATPEAEATAPAPETAAPATGIVLCVIPAVVALGAVAVSKKH